MKSDRFDWILRGGTVVDGLGGEGVRADVGLAGDRIAAVGDLSRAQAAKAGGIWTVALVGGKGGKLAELADESLCVASSHVTARIQEGHGMIVHALCQLIEEKLAD